MTTVWLLVVLVLVGVRLALNPIARWAVRRALRGLDGLVGDVEAVQVSFLPLRVKLRGLHLRQMNAPQREPLLEVEDVSMALIARELWRGRIVVAAQVHQPVVYAPLALLTEEGGGSVDLDRTLTGLVPARLERLEVRQGALIFLDGQARIEVDEIELSVENLVTRRRLDQRVPVALALRAVVQQSGVMTVIATADLLQPSPAFTGQAELRQLQLDTLGPMTRLQAGVVPHGQLDAYVTFTAAAGRLSGEIKPLFEHLRLDAADDSLAHRLTATAVNAAQKVIADHLPGRDAIVTVLPIKGSIDKPHPLVWPTILGVVQNAFVRAIRAGFADMPRAGVKEAPPTFATSKTTQQMFKRDGLAKLQAALALALRGDASVHETGVFDEETQDALLDYQARSGSAATGMPDYASIERLGLAPAEVFHHEPPSERVGVQ